MRAASQLVEALARRVGCIPDGQQQRWSPFNVPLMWSAARTSATAPIVEWMVGASRGLTIPAVEFHEGSMEPDAAVVAGWSALREVFRGWGPWQRKISPRGFVKTDSLGVQLVTTFLQGPKSTFCDKLAQSTAEWRCLEVMYVLITVHVGRQLAVLDVASVTVPMPPPQFAAWRSRKPFGSFSTKWIWETFFCNAFLF